jgi:AraC family transcriptional regulator of adaptative response/methylated-DNA-[protein]-cysteine methyltransferase
MEKSRTLKFSCLNSPLGLLLAISDEIGLYLLKFVQASYLQKEVELFCQKNAATIMSGSTSAIDTIERELNEYFRGNLHKFTTPIHLVGTSFQKKVWEELKNIPFGETLSYAKLATRIGKPSAHRAVANANGANSLAIIIPCHRVIRTNGNLGGYTGGVVYKEYLLDHEKRFIQKMYFCNILDSV